MLHHCGVPVVGECSTPVSRFHRSKGDEAGRGGRSPATLKGNMGGKNFLEMGFERINVLGSKPELLENNVSKQEDLVTSWALP